MQLLWSTFDQHLSSFKNILISVSGGPDSRALLEALATWPTRVEKQLVVVSIDHGQRNGSFDEAHYIAFRAKRLGFAAHVEILPSFIEKSPEHLLRDLRYKALVHTAKRFNCEAVCTAHHGDDDAEGFLMALMGVGGGELGAAMNEIEQFDNFTLVRPFLSLAKKDLLLSLSLLSTNDFVVDKLDEARVGERAFVRHEILPVLSKKTPEINRRLANFAKIQRKNNRLIYKAAKSLIIWRDNTALIALDKKVDPHLITYALWFVLKKMSNSRDLRSSKATIDKIIGDFSMDIKVGAKPSGLDHDPNGITLNPLNRKEYQFPGVLIIKDSCSIVARCVV